MPELTTVLDGLGRLWIDGGRYPGWIMNGWRLEDFG